MRLLGILFVFGGVGVAFTPTHYVPGAVLVAAGVVYVLMGSALLLSGAAELTYRARALASRYPRLSVQDVFLVQRQTRGNTIHHLTTHDSRSEATLRVAFVTVGDTNRLTGGYLYNARVIAGLRQGGIEVEEVVASGAAPEEQAEAASRFSLDVGRFDVVVVDALARVVCAPHLDRWRETLPVVAMVHELPSVATGDAWERTFEESLLRSDLLVTVSDHGASIITGRGIPAGRVRVVPPGFDRLSPDSGTEPSVREGASLRVLCVAQWIPRKGILDLVRAWTVRERPSATLDLIGETDADPDYATSVRAAVAGSSIVVRGPVDDAALARAYAAADLFALPSRYEGYGVVYAEALAHALPVLACDAGPVPELVGEEAALLVPPGDVGALSEALSLLLGDAALRRRMSGAAKRRAANLPRWKDAVAGFRHVLREAVAVRREDTVSG